MNVEYLWKIGLCTKIKRVIFIQVEHMVEITGMVGTPIICQYIIK